MTERKPTYDELMAEVQELREHLQAIQSAADACDLAHTRWSDAIFTAPDQASLHEILERHNRKAESNLFMAVRVSPAGWRLIEHYRQQTATNTDGWENEGGALLRDAE